MKRSTDRRVGPPRLGGRGAARRPGAAARGDHAASNIIEHPELTYRPEVDPGVMWAKFDAMREGAATASARR
jgi:hypothetical protein